MSNERHTSDPTYQTLVSVEVDPDGTFTAPPADEPAKNAPAGFPERIAERYERRELLGRGGMGEVWRVYDEHLNRTVACKVLHGTFSQAVWIRFEEEARVSAQLQHPGIIPVHDVGRLDDGRLWFTMKEVRGRTLQELIGQVHKDWRLGREGSWTFRRLLEGMLRVCETVAYAHARGVVHRDLKPANLMFGDYGEVLVVDWGIAKVLREATSEHDLPVESSHQGNLTRVGSVSGTPRYMSPEQAQGRSDQVGPQADVYALGATLYDVLTERPPRLGKNMRHLLLQTSTGYPDIQPPSAHGTGAFAIDEALDRIVLTALAFEEEDRWADAGELAEQLRAWLDGAQKRERARALIEASETLLEESRQDRERAAQLQEQATAHLEQLDNDALPEQKAPAWALQDEARELEQRATDAWNNAVHRLRASLTHAPDFELPHTRLAELFHERHRALEEAGHAAEARQVAGELAEHDRGAFAAYLKGTGAVTLITDRPVEVKLHRFVEVGRRLQPRFERVLGTAPLLEVPLEMGNYLLTLHAEDGTVVRYPVWIRRQEHWDGVPPDGSEPRVIAIPKAGELAEDDVYVPAGWFWMGHAHADSTLPLERAWAEGLVVKKHPVTVGEYVVFLNDVLEREGEEAALALEPFIAKEGPYFERGPDGRWLGIAAGVEGLEGWPRTPTMPATLITLIQARGYAAWRARREEANWRLPKHFEWVHAARGADQRLYPWGDFFDPGWCQMRFSPGSKGVRPIGERTSDTSVYGALGFAGNVSEWSVEGVGVGGSASGGPLTSSIPRILLKNTSLAYRHPTHGVRCFRSLGETIATQPSSLVT